MLTLNTSARNSALTRSGDAEGFPQHQIGVLQTGSANRIARAGAQRELRREGEGAGVEPLLNAAARHAATRDDVGVAHAIGALHAEAEVRVRVGGLRDGHHIAGLNANQSRDLPSGEFPEARDLPGPPSREHLRDVAIRERPFRAQIVGVGHAGVGDGSGKDGVGKDAGGVVDQLRERCRRR